MQGDRIPPIPPGATSSFRDDPGVGCLSERADSFGKAFGEDFYTAVSDSTYLILQPSRQSLTEEAEGVLILLLLQRGIWLLRFLVFSLLLFFTLFLNTRLGGIVVNHLSPDVLLRLTLHLLAIV